MVDHSDHVSMKNAAKCDNLREMQKPVNVEFSNSNGTHSYSVRMFFRLLDSYQIEILQWPSAFSGWPNKLNTLSCFSKFKFNYQRRIEQGYGLNLSILISPGKENNCDSPSNGE